MLETFSKLRCIKCIAKNLEKVSCYNYAPVCGSKCKETLGYTADGQVALVSSCSAVQAWDTCVFLHDISWRCLWEQTEPD